MFMDWRSLLPAHSMTCLFFGLSFCIINYAVFKNHAIRKTLINVKLNNSIMCPIIISVQNSPINSDYIHLFEMGFLPT